jgi:hypothetical protein
VRTVVTRTFFGAGGALVAGFSPQPAIASEKNMVKERILNIVCKKGWAGWEQLRRAVCIIDIAFCLAHRVRLQQTEGRSRCKTNSGEPIQSGKGLGQRHPNVSNATGTSRAIGLLGNKK